VQNVGRNYNGPKVANFLVVQIGFFLILKGDTYKIWYLNVIK
jgi:hypothetical protein